MLPSCTDWKVDSRKDCSVEETAGVGPVGLDGTGLGPAPGRASGSGVEKGGFCKMTLT